MTQDALSGTQDDRAARLREAIRKKKAARDAEAKGAGARGPGERDAGDSAQAARTPIARRPAHEPARLDALQRGLWLAHRLDPASPENHLVDAYRWPGTGQGSVGRGGVGLDQDRLEAALRRVVRRHRILRSSYRLRGEDVVQEILPAEGVDEVFHLEVIHLESRLETRPDGEDLYELAVREARRPFDLTRPPLLRLLWISAGAGEGERDGDDLLVLVLHHVLADERSLEIFWRDFAAAYREETGETGETRETRETGETGETGKPVPPADTLQFDDYVHWRRTRPNEDPNEGPHEDAHEDTHGDSVEREAWRRRLEPPPAHLDLPFARAGTDAADRAGRLVHRLTAPGLAEAVRRLAARTGTTPFLVCAFAYRVLLHRYGQEHAAFASPVSTRFHPAAAEMIGYFTNPVLMPTDLDESERVEVAVRRFGQAARECLAQASLPFQELVETLDPAREPGRHPLFQTLFVFRRPGPSPALGSVAGAVSLDSVSLERVPLDLGVAKFDLTVFVTETSTETSIETSTERSSQASIASETALELAAEFRTGRYGPADVERLLARFETLLEQLTAVRGPEQTVAEVSWLLPGEAERLRGFAEGPPLREELEPLPRRFESMALGPPGERTGEPGGEPAVLFADPAGGRTFTFAELGHAARGLARRLRGAGVEPGDRVGLFLGRSAEQIAAVVGCHAAGAAYVPLDPTYPAERNRLVLDDADVAAVLTSENLAERLPAGETTVVVLARPEPGSSEIDASEVFTPVLEPEDLPAYLVYTSGSTGRPKGVVVSQENLRRSTAARLQAYGELGVRPGRHLLLPSLAFDSSVAGLFWSLAVGDTLVLPTDDDARDPRRLVELVEREAVTSLLCVPSLYGQMLRLAGEISRPASALASLEAVIVAGESCPWTLVAEHFDRLPDVRLFNEYGPTEATVWATLHEIAPDEVPEERSGSFGRAEPVSIGRPIPGVRIDLEDARGRPVPAGMPGRAWIAGKTVCRMAGETETGDGDTQNTGSARFQEGPDGVRRYRTGDLLQWTEDGRLLFLGREDEQIKLRGFRIEPGEIEAACLSLEGVERAAVVVRGEDLVAFLEVAAPDPAVAAPEHGTDWARRLRSHLAERLPAHMVPSRAVALRELPRLPNGKVDRGRLRRMHLDPAAPRRAQEDGDDGDGDELPSDREQALRSLWKGLLGLDSLGLDDNFFELGGHSLRVAEMALSIERDLGVRIDAADVFQHPTVRHLAERLDEISDRPAAGLETRSEPGAAPPSYEHLFPIQPTGSEAPLLFCIPHFFSAPFAAHFRGRRPVYGLRGISLRQGGNLGRWPTLGRLADDLVDEVERRFPRPPRESAYRSGADGFLVAGYSFGASMAVELVRRMEARGLAVRRLLLIAPMPLDVVRLGPLSFSLRPLRRPVRELTRGEALRIWLRDHDPRKLRTLRRVWRGLKVQPLRRALRLLGRLRKALGLPLSAPILHADVRVDRFRLHRRYRPEELPPLETPTVIFNPDENAEVPGTDSAATWRPVFRHLEVIETPDPHRDDEAVAAATRRILEYLGP